MEVHFPDFESVASLCRRQDIHKSLPEYAENEKNQLASRIDQLAFDTCGGDQVNCTRRAFFGQHWYVEKAIYPYTER